MAVSIWVDADACPVAIKEILFKAGPRAKTRITFVANHAIRVPPSPWLTRIQVEKGFDIADNEIVQRVNDNDLVITSDIPLADEVIAKGALVVTPRGEPLTKENIRSRLNIRDFMDTMRASGVQTSGPPPLSQRERQAFANTLDRFLAHAG
ncbi:YaiI/YqxD family protein [Alteromonas sp. C1M14]|uniref:YaiI/YqxD family protein n=1 Tax=Alteromonas sp. C1M14 TaxID=2841567 RepID=UPI001C095A32|nr:YaiI/YqxD family protein [Alteromonas sp. C1M14]MBU2978640.1 YaiI/YqxD family protein [Alteromonas sp. C1M14]